MKSKGIDDKTGAEAAKVNLARAALYSFLSRAFKIEVDELYLESISAIQPTIQLLSESQGNEELRGGNSLLLEFTTQLAQLRGDERKNLLTDLAAEYASLFLGVGPKPVHLVESVYLGKDHLLYEQPYHEILEAYRSLGFEKDKDFPEPEDHISVEFEFMANLCTWTSKTLDAGDIENAVAYINLQKEFLRDHVVRWVPDLCKRLEETATSTFYKAMAHLTSGFITMDNELPDYLSENLKDSLPARK